MNNEKIENNRFYESVEVKESDANMVFDMSKGEWRPLQGPTEHISVSATQQCAIPHKEVSWHAGETKPTLGFMEYAPEPQNMIEARSAGLKFTVGTKYPVLEKKESGINGLTFKTYNDLGTEIWINEKYFIANSDAKLLWNDYEFVDGCPTYNPKNFVKNDHFGKTDGKEETIDIRKVAKEKNIPLTVEKPLSDFAWASDLKELSGLTTEEYHPDWESEEKEPADEKYSEFNAWDTESRKRQNSYEYTYDIIEGLVKDSGNPLVSDINKCMAAVSKVFGKGDIADPDDLIISIKKHTKSLVTWKEGFLAIEGVKTKITYDEAQKAYNGLQAITNTNKAKKIVGKLLADKIKTLF